MQQPSIEWNTVQKALKPFIHHCPMMESNSLNEMWNMRIRFKCENFQKMGAFKMRGATYALHQLSEEERKRGVITHSSGNFAQAVAKAGKSMGISAMVVMPKDAPQAKIDAVKGYGAEIIFCEPGTANREAAVDEWIKKTGRSPLHPSNQWEVIVGNGTAACEIIAEAPDAKGIITPVGGGGLLAGTALATKQLAPHMQVWGGEPETMNDAYRSLQSGVIESNPAGSTTIADGLRTQLGDINFPIIQQHVDGIQCVSEEKIAFWQGWVWERMKLVIEPSSAVALAALEQLHPNFKGQEWVVIISGGNCSFPSPKAL